MSMAMPAESQRWPHRATCAAVVLLMLLALAGCETEETIIRYKPFLTGVENAQFGGQKPVNPNAGYVDPTAVVDNRIVIENRDGSKTLISRSVRHMMTHVQTCLTESEDQLLLDQVISDRTKEEFRTQGKDPMEIVAFLHDHEQEVFLLFSRMPFGEHSPTIVLEQPGNKTWILRVQGPSADGLKYTKLWAILEKGNWKFLWIS